jgi:tetratricopeptide (TPR) repeat protein
MTVSSVIGLKSSIRKRTNGSNRRVPDRTREALIRLEREPGNTHLWRELLDAGNETGSQFELPSALIGSPAQALDSELCLAKGEALLRKGYAADATIWLRTAATVATTRAAAFEISCRAAALDPEFCRLVGEADRFRDGGEWDCSANRYGRALQLYPDHAGYMIQYGHCAKEKGSFESAEIWYRSALSYAVHRPSALRHGISLHELMQHLRYSAALLGYNELEGGDPNILPTDPGDCELLNELPTRADVIFTSELLHAHTPDDGRVLMLMRSNKTVEALFLALIKDKLFIQANRRALWVYSNNVP